jgi:DNA-directed RNA polymerase specialized sigma24 family protein
VTLRYCGDLSHREIAVVMDTTEAAARRSVFEGLARLKKEIAGEPSGSHESARPAVQKT